MEAILGLGHGLGVVNALCGGNPIFTLCGECHKMVMSYNGNGPEHVHEHDHEHVHGRGHDY